MIELPQAVYDGLTDHAIEGAPDEVCGILGGAYGDERSVVRSYHRAANAAETPRTEYAIDPEEQLALIDTIEAADQAVAGFYHSHPAGPPGPSETDAARATWPGLSYVIVVLDGEHPYLGAWRWNDESDRFEQEIVRRV
jgi:proteasome lid subunit RPN8/RPN11